MMNTQSFILSVLCLPLFIFHKHVCEQTPTLLISLDGLQAKKLDEFLNKNPNSAINKFFVNLGVKSDYMKPSFPTLTFPNHNTLVTGLYMESHGIVSNQMYDPNIDKGVNLLTDDFSKDKIWWNQAEPIWLTAKKQVKV